MCLFSKYDFYDSVRYILNILKSEHTKSLIIFQTNRVIKILLAVA